MEPETSNKKYTKQASRFERGFTIPELLVALFMFSLIIGGATNLLLSGIAGQRSSLAMQELLDQSSFTLEYMARSLRQAKKDLDPICLAVRGLNYELTQEGSGVRFINIQGQCQEFRLTGDRVEEVFWVGGGISSQAFLTSDNLAVTSLQFILQGAGQDDDVQPRITLALEIGNKGGKLSARSDLQLQTTISQRSIDVPK
ncbi:MAG: prepilin-type N-terminal cleavage/methylation domain-containing protein [bacterium]|nr:prepilin-type N-terminal cleavage/methylation domain-containing protein [bacterium]